MRKRSWILAGLVLALAGTSPAQRPWPVTSSGIHVFNDQLVQGMTDAQVAFCATHYAGTQKMRRSEADRLRAVNPDFLIFHYRLGLGLGYRATQGGCNPTGEWLLIVEGDDWVQEWPGNATVQEDWFYHWPEGSATRVYQCDWGWYLVDPGSPGWRTWWSGEVARQLAANDDDGVFMDSCSVPNFMGGNTFNPTLPDVDPSFENAWQARIRDYLAWLKSHFAGRTYIVPNVGGWITSRDATDYSAADGLMIEGFALEADASPLAFDDWRLQMDRVLAATNRGQAIMAQTYVSGAQERMYTVGSYLLVKGSRTYVNIDVDLDPEWWPEYDIPIGLPVSSALASIDELDPNGDSVFRRDYDNGVILVNPTNPWDGSGVTRQISLGAPFRLAVGSGGGSIGADGAPAGSLTFETVTEVNLPPATAAVLLFETAQKAIGDLDSDGRVNAVDLLVLRLYLSGAVTQGNPPFAAPLAAADVNRDFLRSEADSAALANILVSCGGH